MNQGKHNFSIIEKINEMFQKLFKACILFDEDQKSKRSEEREIKQIFTPLKVENVRIR